MSSFKKLEVNSSPTPVVVVDGCDVGAGTEEEGHDGHVVGAGGQVQRCVAQFVLEMATSREGA